MSNSKQCKQISSRQNEEYYYDSRTNSREKSQNSGTYYDGSCNNAEYNKHSVGSYNDTVYNKHSSGSYSDTGYNKHSGGYSQDDQQVMSSDKFGDSTIYELSNNNTFMIIGYLLCWPFCLYLMWKYNNWNKTVKIIVSIACGLFGLGIIIRLVGAVGIFSLFL